MDIKPTQGSRIAGLLYTAWRGVVWFLVPEDFDRHLLRGR